MVRGLSASPGLQQQLDKYWNKDDGDQLDALDTPDAAFVAGFVVGQRTTGSHNQNHNWLVLHLAPTPNPEEDQDEEDQVQGKGGHGHSPPSCVEQVDVAWMLEHYTQIVRMLPGGINVIGAFFVTDNENQPGDIFNSAAASNTIKKLAKCVMQREEQQSQSGSDFEFAVLHMSRPGQTVTAKWVVDAAQQFKQTEFVVEQHQEKWLRVQGTFLIDLPVVFGAKEASRKGLLQEKVDAALAPLEKSINDAHVIIDGSFRPQQDKLDPNYRGNQHERVASKGGKNKNKSKNKNKNSKRRRDEQEEDEDDQDEELENDDDDDVEGIKTFTAEILLDDDTNEQDDCKASKHFFTWTFVLKVP